MQQPSAPTLKELRDAAAKQRLVERAAQHATRRSTPAPSVSGEGDNHSDARSQLSVLSRRSSGYRTASELSLDHYSLVDGIYMRRDENMDEYLPAREHADENSQNDTIKDGQAKLQKLSGENLLKY